MMESNQLKSRSRLIGAVAVVLPVLSVLGVGHVLPKPVAAQAKQQASARAEAATLKIPSEEWLRSRVRAEAASVIEGSPFPAVVTASLIPESYEAELPPNDEPDIEPEPSIKLTAIMRSSSGDLALIGGKAHGVGGRIEGSWIVSTIDAATRTVTLIHEGDGREFVTQIKGP